MAGTPEWVKNLTVDNFLAVYDVALDIREALQLSDDVAIPILPTIVHFARLMPGDGINMRDHYCELRWKAANLLKAKGCISNVEVLQGLHRWESRLRISLDSDRFLPIVGLLDEEYQCRTKASSVDDRSENLPSAEVKRDPLDEVRRFVLRFHAVAVQLRERYDNRPTLDVNDEYDVQDLLHGLLYLQFDDVRPEEWTPSYAGKAARVDFLLKPERIVIEVKKTRSGLGVKEVGEQLILDIARYSKHAECKTLVCMVYDPENRILNPGGLQADLSGQKEGIAVEVIVVPKRY